MHTIRGRLVFWYAVALGATMFVFALMIYLAQRSENLAELDARARVEADFAAQVLAVAQREPGGAVTPDAKTGHPTLAPRVAERLAVIPDFIVVLGANNETLYLSSSASALSGGSFVKLLEQATQNPGPGGFGSVSLDLPVGEVRYYV